MEECGHRERCEFECEDAMRCVSERSGKTLSLCKVSHILHRNPAQNTHADAMLSQIRYVVAIPPRLVVSPTQTPRASVACWRVPTTRSMIARQTDRVAPRAPSYLFQSLLQTSQLVLLDHQCLVVEILHNVVVPVGVDLEDDCLDGRVAFDQHAWMGGWFSSGMARERSLKLAEFGGYLPLMALGMLPALARPRMLPPTSARAAIQPTAGKMS
jgi:hypothetical protein